MREENNRNMEENDHVLNGHPSQYVKLNVGGRLFYTTIGTLTSHDTIFNNPKELAEDAEGWIFIDRCGSQFGTVLNYLRDGTVPLPESYKELSDLLAETKYYRISDLTKLCAKALLDIKNAKFTRHINFVTSEEEKQHLINVSRKPVVVLLINRDRNNPTGSAYENLLRNIQLFEELFLKYNARMFFIKDIISSTEVCCWSFYGHGKILAKIVCSNKEGTYMNVAFPQTKIYEEALNALLYENKNVPDHELSTE